MSWTSRWFLLVACCVAAGAARADWPPGTWRSVGYGELLDIKADGYRHFEVTAISCIERPARPRRVLEQALGTVVGSLGDSAEPTALTVRRGISVYEWRRVQSLPAACRDSAAPIDARAAFDIVWTTLDEHYAFFAERGVDWAAVRRNALTALPPGTDDDALFEVLSRALAPLRDQHVRLRAGERLFVSGRPSAPAVEPDGLTPGYLQLIPALKRFLQDGTVVQGLQSTASDQLWWGRVGADVGYIALPSLWDFTPDAETDQDRQSAAADAAMDEVLAALRGVRGIVLDLRVNSGGSDAVGLAIAGRFADRARVAFTKQAVHERGRTPPYEVAVAPRAGEQFRGPVVVLIGPLTASAAEVMTLGLRVLPQATLLGRRTLGVFSDTLYRRLPNGWEFTLSNEIYQTPERQLFEGLGIPPHVASATPSPPRSLDERFGVDIRAARELIIRATPQAQ
jgi:hypothetical protein